MSDNRPPVYLEESLVDGVPRERWVFRASGLGGCDGALVRAARGEVGESPPGWLLERYQEGTDAEEEILGRFLDGAVEPSARQDEPLNLDSPSQEIPPPEGFEQHELELPVGPSAVIRCHPDALTTTHVLEAKFFGPDYWESWKAKGLAAFPYYEMQVSIEMLVTGKPCVFIVAQKVIGEEAGEGRVVKIGEVQYEVIAEPPIPLGRIKARVARLVSLIESGKDTPCNTRAFPCPFYRLDSTLCGGLTEDGVDEAPMVGEDDASELLVAIEQYRKGQEQEKAGKALKGEWGPRLVALVERFSSKKGGKVRVRGKGIDASIFEVTDHVEDRPARVVEYKAGEVRYPRIKIQKGDG